MIGECRFGFRLAKPASETRRPAGVAGSLHAASSPLWASRGIRKETLPREEGLRWLGDACREAYAPLRRRSYWFFVGEAYHKRCCTWLVKSLEHTMSGGRTTTCGFGIETRYCSATSSEGTKMGESIAARYTASNWRDQEISMLPKQNYTLAPPPRYYMQCKRQKSTARHKQPPSPKTPKQKTPRRCSMRLNWCGGVPLFLQFLNVFNERLLMHQPSIMPVS